MDEPTLGRDDEAPTHAEPIVKVPDRLGPCRLLRLIGSGGMATVYAAELAEDRPYGSRASPVAVKVLDRERFGGVDAVRRFLREAQLGRSIDHPGVVRTLDGGSASAGGTTFHYLVLEYVEGRSLSSLIRELRIVPEALLRDLALQAASALKAIHAAGVVHRDVKPSNILITPDHQVKLMDLGIARPVEEDERLTRGGLFIGTALYASPEQLRGEDVGPTSDLYSLGVSLFEAATGSQPFSGGGVRAVMHRHFEVVPVRAGRVNPAVSPFLEELIACLVEKEPRLRLVSAAALVELLEAGEASAWWLEREGSARAARPRGELAGLRVPRDTPVVGRDAELEILGEAFAEARAGRGRTVLIEGEAGVGKSRLVDEMVGRWFSHSDAPCILYGSHAPGGRGGSPTALAEGAVALLGEAHLESALSRYLTVTPRLVPAFAAYLTGASPPRGADPLSGDAVHAVFCHLARALSAERLVVWIVEDLHFASADSRALLVSLARIAHDQRLLIIATSRPGLGGDEVAWLDRLDTTRHLSLDRLSPREVIQLLADALRSQQLAERLGGKIAVKSDGNPFFIFEMLKELKDRASLREQPDGSFTASDDAERLTVPTSVRDLLLAHIKDLAAPDRALLDVGAVQGFAFDPDLVARVRGLKRLAVLESLAAIERKNGVIRAIATGFEFRHHQLQEVLLGALPPLLRVEYEGLLAESFEERGGFRGRSPEEVPGEAAVFMAEHYLRGGRKDCGDAVVLRAIDHLAALYRNESLLELADLALRTIGPEEQTLRFEIHLRQAACLELLARRGAQQTACESALACATAVGDVVLMVRARLALAELRQVLADYDGAQEILQACVASDAAAGPDLRGRCLRLLGRVSLLRGDHVRAGQYYDEQHAIHRSQGSDLGLASALQDLAGLYVWTGRYSQARECLREALELWSHEGSKRGEATTSSALGIVLSHEGRYDLARSSFERSLSVSREIGYRHGEIVAEANLAQLSLEEGRLDDAESRLRVSAELVAALSSQHLDIYVLLYQGHLARARGDARAARLLYERSLECSRRTKARAASAEAALALGRQLLDDGDVGEARPLLGEAAALVAEMSLAEPGAVPAAYLALLGEAEPSAVPVSEATSIAFRAEAHLVLALAGARQPHAAQALLLFERMSQHLSGSEAERFWSQNLNARRLRSLTPAPS